jgi:AraC-like DNA-binding protein/mannose-6-phosphate isomerase-like protein (cupin superfamily)
LRLARIPVWAIQFRDWDIPLAMTVSRLFDHDETVPRPVISIAHDYPASFELERHHHVRNQLLHAEKGVVTVSTPHGAWTAPSERAVWIPAGVPHAVRMVGAVSTRSVLIASETLHLGDRCRVVGVSPLLRQLLIAATGVEPEYDLAGRDGLVMDLLVAELARAPVIPLSAPFPQNPALAAKCHAFLERPSPHDSIDGWAEDLRLGRRAFTRAFRRETGMSFAEWRQQACVLVALPRLAAGEPVTAIALDLGYDSPAAFATMFKRLTGIPPSRHQS